MGKSEKNQTEGLEYMKCHPRQNYYRYIVMQIYLLIIAFYIIIRHILLLLARLKAEMHPKFGKGAFVIITGN